MDVSAPLATLPVSFFDRRSGVSALALQHVRADGRTVLVYHDAPSVGAARPLLSGIAETLLAALAPGQTLSIIESSVPEHDAEHFAYARVTLTHAAWTGRVTVTGERAVAPAEVAGACGIQVRELVRTQAVVRSIHRPRACAFSGFRQLALGERPRPVLAVA